MTFFFIHFTFQVVSHQMACGNIQLLLLGVSSSDFPVNARFVECVNDFLSTDSPT